MSRHLATETEIKALRGLDAHATRIFLPLSKMIDAFGPAQSAPLRPQALVFFDYVKSRYSDKGYRKVQEHYLSPKNVEYITSQNVMSSEVKYLDFPYWANAKVATANSIKLASYAGGRVLDIGAGPGHFGVVAEHLGVHYDGLEVPLVPRTPHTKEHLFDALCEFFQVSRIKQRVDAMTPLVLEHRYSLVTCLMGNFCTVFFADGTSRPWNWAEWAFFLDDLVSNHTTETFFMYFKVSRDLLPPDVVANLERFAKRCDLPASLFTFDQTLDIAAVRASVAA